MPGGICWKLYSPSAFDFLVCVNPLSRFVRVTSAWGVAAPPGSTTVPCSEVTAVCDSERKEQRKITLRSNTLILHNFIEIPPWRLNRPMACGPSKNTGTNARRHPENTCDGSCWETLFQSLATHFFPFPSSRSKLALLGALYGIEWARRCARKKETGKLHRSHAHSRKKRNCATKCQADCRLLCHESNSKFI